MGRARPRTVTRRIPTPRRAGLLAPPPGNEGSITRQAARFGGFRLDELPARRASRLFVGVPQDGERPARAESATFEGPERPRSSARDPPSCRKPPGPRATPSSIRKGISCSVPCAQTVSRWPSSSSGFSRAAALPEPAPARGGPARRPGIRPRNPRYRGPVQQTPGAIRERGDGLVAHPGGGLRVAGGRFDADEPPEHLLHPGLLPAQCGEEPPDVRGVVRDLAATPGPSFGDLVPDLLEHRDPLGEHRGPETPSATALSYCDAAAATRS